MHITNNMNPTFKINARGAGGYVELSIKHRSATIDILIHENDTLMDLIDDLQKLAEELTSINIEEI